jgi:toxin ParE1/3/4
MEVIILHPVWPEFVASADWYHLQRLGLDIEFKRELDVTLTKIAELPHLFPQIHRDARRAQLERFPYGVFFVIRHGDIYVFAIQHLHRNPRVWKRLIPRKRRRAR